MTTCCCTIVVSVRSRERLAVEVPLFRGFVAHAPVGQCLEATGEGAVSSCSAEPKTPDQLPRLQAR